MIVGALVAFAGWLVLSAVLARALRCGAGGDNDSSARTFRSVILGGYLFRILFQFVIRDIQFFSHAVGGDALNYEAYAQMLAVLWRRTGVFYATSADFPVLGATTMPANLFAWVVYANGGDLSRLGCTALVATAAGLTAVNIYALARQFGATPRNAMLMASLLYLEPAFLFYTSDTYKDGIVLCVTIGALASALRLSVKFSYAHAAIGAVCLVALWHVRFYLVFAAVTPLIVALAGLGSRRLVRPLVVALLVAAALIGVSVFTDLLQSASVRATETFEGATASRTIAANYNDGMGSGVAFDDGGVPTGALAAKLAYVVFSPFPWADGSFGFQVGKLDALVWYFVMVRAARALRTADRRLVLMLVTFAVPMALAYAMTMANVGLIVRQRLTIVAATAIVAATYTPSVRGSKAALRGMSKASKVPTLAERACEARMAPE